MIEFYGSPMSSSGRTHWMLEEVGVAYDYKRVDTRAGQTRTPEFLRMYGGGKIPVLRDGDLVLGESMAINFYLAEKYKPELMPDDMLGRAQTYQWSFWALTNLQPDLLSIMFDSMLPEEARDPGAYGPVKKRVHELLKFFEDGLSGKHYLVGERFSVADVNAGSVMNLALATGMLADYPHISAWMTRLTARPAFVRARGAQ
jgi:glutathione S-transferase